MSTARVTPTESTTALGVAGRTITLLNTSPSVDVTATLNGEEVLIPRGAQAVVTGNNLASVKLRTTVGVAVVQIKASIQ
jgi:hypothetical protein